MLSKGKVQRTKTFKAPAAAPTERISVKEKGGNIIKCDALEFAKSKPGLKNKRRVKPRSSV